MQVKNPTVLVVDDEPTIADTIAVILNQNGFVAHSVFNARDAVTVAAQIRPDVMITDFIMPDKSGVQVAVEVQALVPQCKIVLCSGCPTSIGMLGATAAANRWQLLSKPIDPQQLLAQLQRLVNDRRAE